jgi:hypothetical protein
MRRSLALQKDVRLQSAQFSSARIYYLAYSHELYELTGRNSIKKGEDNQICLAAAAHLCKREAPLVVQLQLGVLLGRLPL